MSRFVSALLCSGLVSLLFSVSTTAAPVPQAAKKPALPDQRTTKGSASSRTSKATPHHPHGAQRLTIFGRSKQKFDIHNTHIDWTPSAGARRAHYRRYRFPRGEFMRVVGKPGQFKMRRVWCYGARTSVRLIPNPAGTVRITTTHCRLIDPSSHKAHPKVTLHLPHDRRKAIQRSAVGKHALVTVKRTMLKQKVKSGAVSISLNPSGRFARPSAFYKLWLSEQALRQHFNKHKVDALRLVVKILNIKTGIYMPSQPNMPHPIGGFRTYDINARIVSAGPALTP